MDDEDFLIWILFLIRMIDYVEQPATHQPKNYFLKRHISFMLENFILFIIPIVEFHRKIVGQCVPIVNSFWDHLINRYAFIFIHNLSLAQIDEDIEF